MADDDLTTLSDDDKKLLELAGINSAEGLFIGLLVMGIRDMRSNPGGAAHATRLLQYLVEAQPTPGHEIPPKRLAKLRILQKMLRLEDAHLSNPFRFSVEAENQH